MLQNGKGCEWARKSHFNDRVGNAGRVYFKFEVAVANTRKDPITLRFRPDKLGKMDEFDIILQI